MITVRQPEEREEIEETPVSRGNVQREHAFQRVAIAFIRKVLPPPMWITAICHENELTENARARAAARGVQKGVHDLYVCQAYRISAWIELKWGKNTPSDAQEHVAGVLSDCGIPHGFAWNIHDVLDALLAANFAIHGNAENLAVEYQARAEAAVARAEINAGRRPKSRASSKPRTRRPTAAQVARAERGRWLP